MKQRYVRPKLKQKEKIFVFKRLRLDSNERNIKTIDTVRYIQHLNVFHALALVIPSQQTLNVFHILIRMWYNILLMCVCGQAAQVIHLAIVVYFKSFPFGERWLKIQAIRMFNSWVHHFGVSYLLFPSSLLFSSLLFVKIHFHQN